MVRLKLSGKLAVRDLWRQKGLANSMGQFQLPIPHTGRIAEVKK